MHGEDDLHILQLLYHVADRTVDMAHRFAEILPAMGRDEKDTVIPKIDLRQFLRQHVVFPNGMVQGIDNGVARDKDTPIRDTLRAQILI